MTLEVIIGDVFENIEKRTIIAHGCNNQSVMGAGIALTIKNRFPGAYKAYINAPQVLGTVSWYHHDDDLSIANCITQTLDGRSRNLNYVALISSLQRVVQAAKLGGYEVRFPFIGGGLGGGNPDFLVDIYSDLFNNENVIGKLYIYEGPK